MHGASHILPRSHLVRNSRDHSFHAQSDRIVTSGCKASFREELMARRPTASIVFYTEGTTVCLIVVTPSRVNARCTVYYPRH